MEHETILKLIEEVDPKDTAKLDEIDARVWCFVNNVEFFKVYPRDSRSIGCFIYTDQGKNKNNYLALKRMPTRSRDALKEIRPNGWSYQGGTGGWAEMTQSECQYPKENTVLYGRGKTEELAELRAIISAIAYERGK